MNLQQLGCPEGEGRDLWFRMPTNLSLARCESVGAYTGVLSIILILNMTLLIGCFLGMVFTAANVNNVRRNFAFCFVYLSFNSINLWLALTHEEYIAFMSQGASLALLGAAMSVYFTEALTHYKDMEQLNKKLLGNFGESSLAKTFVEGIHNSLGKDTALDKFLLSTCVLSIVCHATFMIILVPVAPAPTIPWYAPGGSLFQKDFFVSLGMWSCVMMNSSLVTSALLLMRRMSNYLSAHASSQQRASKGEDSTTEWVKKLDALRRKINVTLCVTFVAYFVITGFLVVMSVERLLGMRWWAVLIVINLMGTIQSAFNLSTSFPSKQLRKRYPCLSKILASKKSTASTTPLDDSKQSKLVDVSPTSGKTSTMRTNVESSKDFAVVVPVA